MRLAGHRGHEAAAPPAARHGQGALSVGDGVAVVIAESRAQAKDAAELVDVDYEPLPAVIDPEEALADGARSSTTSSGRTTATRGSSKGEGGPTAVLRRAPRNRQGALPTAAAGPERDRAARRDRPVPDRRRTSTRCGRRRRSRTSPASELAVVARHPRSQAARHRPRCRRRLRLEAERLRRGGARARPGQAARAAGEVDRGALGGLPGDHPRPRPVAGDRDCGNRGRQDQGHPRERLVGLGAYLQLVTRRDADPRRLGLRRRLRHRRLPTRVRRRVHDCHADRRVSRRRSARGDLSQSSGRSTRSRASSTWTRSSSAQELHQGVPEDARVRPDDRLRRLRGRARQGPGDGSTTKRSARAGGATRAAATPKELGIGFSTYTRCAASLRPAFSARSSTPRAAGTRRRSAACRPGASRSSSAPLPTGRATRRRSPRSSPSRLGVPIEEIEVMHGDTTGDPARARHVRQPQPRGRRRRALQRCREGDREGAADRRAQARGGGRTTSSTKAGRFTVQERTAR